MADKSLSIRIGDCAGEGGGLSFVFYSNDSVVTTAVISADVNNYAPAGYDGASILRISSNAPPVPSITGLQAPSPAVARQIILLNVGSQNVRLSNNSASSLAQNRFYLTGDIQINPNEGVIVVYDIADLRWRVAGVYI